MTIDDMWEEYRVQCCLPDDETSEVIYWQRWAFYSAVMATIAKLGEHPERFPELRDSAMAWAQKELAGAN